jgi:hypothetical protein
MDTWTERLEQVKQFIASNGKKPPKTTSIGSWLCDQLCFLRGNKGWVVNPDFAERKAVLEQFIADNENVLLTRDEIWMKKLQEVDDFITSNGKRHAHDHPLNTWVLDQVKQANTGKMPAHRVDAWTGFFNKHSALFLTDDETWENNLAACKQFIMRSGKRPSAATKGWGNGLSINYRQLFHQIIKGL